MEVIPEAVDGKKQPYWWKTKNETGEPELDEEGKLIMDETQPRMKGLNNTHILTHAVRTI